jgi:TRAP-type C4-dicarboxylate transport system permease small subunit
MSGFWNFFQRLVESLKLVGAVCLVGMMAVTCVDVVGRFLGHPLFGSVEIVGFMAILAVAAALPYTHQARAHIGVEIVMRLLPERVQAVVEMVTSIVALGLFALVTWRMALYARTMQKSGEVSMNLEFPEYLIIFAVAICFLVFTVMIIQDITGNMRKLRGGK